MVDCAVCGIRFDSGKYSELATHFLELSEKSDSSHVSWLNRNITKERKDQRKLSRMLSEYYSLKGKSIKDWIIRDFVDHFRGPNPHPFILAMQSYNANVLRGYAIEHHHFLKQWIKSCSYVIAKTDFEDVQDYELENIMTELHGYGKDVPSHHELLIRMGESLGLDRRTILQSNPLPATSKAISIWNRIATNRTWIETMAAMHSLELVANRDLGRHGAKYPYFNPDILSEGKATAEVKDFLREGYEADVSHSYVALDIIEKYCTKENLEDIQGAYLLSANAFSDYLEARLERGEMIEDKQ
ncbi:iron-containing redox enzyme family protein [Oxyplasma meridianum]|uniref:Iron-containing redox enzyme family protein n=1 Tax=Oxyplasma meridianum TaxID=3073602 RepID=A0AAX4NI83_9ARCH